MRKRRFLLTVVLVYALCLSGCFVAWDPDLKYGGEYPKLEACAIRSLIGIASDDENQIIPIDEDEYGRIMFAYYCPNPFMVKTDFGEPIVGLFILQKEDDTNVYFYAEENYLFDFAIRDEKFSEELVNETFAKSQIDALKSRNDWGIRPDQCSRKTTMVSFCTDSVQQLSETAKKQIANVLGGNNRTAFFREDKNGKEIWFVLSIEKEEKQWYVVMLDETGQLLNEDTAILQLDKSDYKDIPLLLQDYLTENLWDEKTG